MSRATLTPAEDTPEARAVRESTAAGRSGASNTRPTAKNGRDTIEAGVDTLRVLFSCGAASGKTLYPICDEAGEVVATAQWYPGLATIAVEGHPVRGKLASPWETQDAMFAWGRALVDQGHARDVSFRAVSRLDSTATTVFEHGSAGVAFLQGMAALDWPRLKPVVYGKPPETVALTYRNSRGRIVARGYDTGLLRGGYERGEAIRLEDQRRFSSGRRPSDVFARGFARERFERRFLPLYKASRGVTVASVPVLAERVSTMVDRGELSPSTAARLLGFVAIQTDARQRFAVRTARRYRAELRELGLVVADDFFEPIEVELSSVLEAALDSPHWGANG